MGYYVGLGFGVVRRLGPGDERGDGAGWAVAIVDFEREAFGVDLGLHRFQRLGRLPHQHAFRRAIAVDRLAGEIIRAA